MSRVRSLGVEMWTHAAMRAALARPGAPRLPESPESARRSSQATQVTASRRLSLSHVTRHHARHTPHGTTAGAGEQTRLIILFNFALFIYTIRGHNIGHMYMCHADAYEATSLATDFRGSVTRQLYYTASHTP
jgi:hypothetical protein